MNRVERTDVVTTIVAGCRKRKMAPLVFLVGGGVAVTHMALASRGWGEGVAVGYNMPGSHGGRSDGGRGRSLRDL